MQETAGKEQPNKREAGTMADVEIGSTISASHVVVARGYKIGPFVLPAYRSPLAQTIVIGFVCFLVVGKSERCMVLS
jgi:hypothetical protein